MPRIRVFGDHDLRVQPLRGEQGQHVHLVGHAHHAVGRHVANRLPQSADALGVVPARVQALGEKRISPSPIRSTCGWTGYTSEATVSSVIDGHAVTLVRPLVGHRGGHPFGTTAVQRMNHERQVSRHVFPPPSPKTRLVIRISLIRGTTNSPGGITAMRIGLAIRVFFKILFDASFARGSPGGPGPTGSDEHGGRPPIRHAAHAGGGDGRGHGPAAQRRDLAAGHTAA